MELMCSAQRPAVADNCDVGRCGSSGGGSNAHDSSGSSDGGSSSGDGGSSSNSGPSCDGEGGSTKCGEEGLLHNIKKGLQQQQGKKVCSITYHCKRAAPTKASKQPLHKVPKVTAKVGCTFRLRLDFVQFPDGLEMQPVVVTPHTNHELGSLEDVQHLRPPAAVLERGKELLLLGLTNKQVQLRVNKEIRTALLDPGNSSSSSSSGDVSSSLVEAIRSGGDAYLQSFVGRRQRLYYRDVKNLQKQLAREQKLHDNDVLAIEDLISSWEALGSDSPVLFYQPQQLDADGNIEQHFVLVLSSSFGLAMINAFGAGEDRMVLMDATGGTNQYGYQLYGMLVVDEWREGVPGAFMITSSQEASEVETFLKVGVCQWAGSIML